MYETEYIKPHLNHTNIQRNIPDIYEELCKLQHPILFIYGELDYLAANAYNTILLARALPDASCLILPKTGHMFFHETIWNTLLDKIQHFINNQ